MKRNLTQARVREATAWLAKHDPGDGHGVIGVDGATDPAAEFTLQVVLDAFAAGAAQGDVEWLLERAMGQRQLDDAHALMTEATELFRTYEKHHREKVANVMRLIDTDTDPSPALAAERRETLAMRAARVQRNCIMASRLEAWMAGKDRYPVSCPEPCRVGDLTLPAEIADNGDLVLIDDKTVETCRAKFDNLANFVGAHPAAGSTHASRPEQIMKEGAFRVTTADPRFDPFQPVLVNGFLYTPTKEAL
jgi:hypothetical protein